MRERVPGQVTIYVVVLMDQPVAVRDRIGPSNTGWLWEPNPVKSSCSFANLHEECIAGLV